MSEFAGNVEEYRSGFAPGERATYIKKPQRHLR